MFRILTKEFQLVYFLKKGLFSVLVQNSPKVTKKVLVFRKVATALLSDKNVAQNPKSC